jgi:SPP1 family predicted phage head-tail adaptor
MGGVGQSYWEDGSQIWGHLQPLSGTEKLVASQMATEEDCKIHLRYSTELTPKTRLRLADTTTIFDVVSVINPDYRNRELILYCRKEV